MDALLRSKKHGSKLTHTARALITDLILNSFRKSKGHRYSDTTKGLLALLHTRGTPTATSLFARQLGLCSSRTIERFIKDNRRPFELGFSEPNFRWLAGFYRSIIESRKLTPGSFLVMLTEDETAITGGMTFCNRTNKIFGHCGRESDIEHKCDCAGIPVDVKRPDAFEYLKKEVEDHRVGRCE